MMAARDVGNSAAKRRRERRLRSMLRSTNVRPSPWSWLRPFTTEGVGGACDARREASAGPAEYFDLTSEDGRPAGEGGFGGAAASGGK